MSEWFISLANTTIQLKETKKKKKKQQQQQLWADLTIFYYHTQLFVTILLIDKGIKLNINLIYMWTNYSPRY